MNNSIEDAKNVRFQTNLYVCFEFQLSFHAKVRFRLCDLASNLPGAIQTENEDKLITGQ